MDDANEPLRVLRGGCWRDFAAFARVARRLRGDPGDRYVYLGVRLVRLLTPLQQVAEVNNGK